DSRIKCLGLSHHTADIGLREKLAFAEDGFIDSFGNAQSDEPIRELIVLSTCNRVEFYCVANDPSIESLEQLIRRHSELSKAEIASSMYHLVDMQAASHLFRVAAGLDSMVLGEAQILGQVTRAYEKAQRAGTTGKILSRLFLMAIHGGKRVRTETALGKNPVSISSIAVQLVMKSLPDLKRAQIVLLGAGEMAELAIEALRKRGADKFHIVSRSLASACKLAEGWQGKASSIDQLSEVIRGADVVITSSSAPHTLIDREMVDQAMRSRSHRPLTIIDIAVPRDVDPEVGDLANVHLYDIDTLNRDLDEGLRARRREVPKVEAILAQEYGEFKAFIDSLTVVPLIVELRGHAENIRQQELEKTLRRLGDLSERQEQMIAALSHSIVQKILHKPTACLRHASGSDEAERYIQAARALFGLEPASHPNESPQIDDTCRG
ncbi:MAG: glutamyl-tRNA reductase, partial [Anaerolineales bacterium]